MGEHDHEMDRRFVDQEFKLRVTGELAGIKADLAHNTLETQSIKEKVDFIQRDMEGTLKGTGRLDTGLVGQTLDNKIAIDELRAYLKRWLPIIGIIVVLFADQLSPIIRDWLYQKTKMKVFYSVAQDFKEKRSIQHVRHYTIIQKADPPETPGGMDVPPPS